MYFAAKTARQTASNRARVVVDCQLLANVVTGRAQLQGDATRPLFVRMGRAVAGLYKRGVRPSSDHEPLIQWRPREFNSVADHLANMALDSAGPYISRAEADVGDRPNIQLHTDGGVRAGQGAIGWVVFAVEAQDDGQPNFRRLACGSHHLGPWTSPFQAEAIALETGLQEMTKYL